MAVTEKTWLGRAIDPVSGNVLVWYQYDPWGKILAIGGSMATTLRTLNPLTYRGYVYDQETGLYYLQSRYYNPEWGRFINADALVSTGGLLGNNMFAYCYSNPINWIDKGGNVPEEIDLNDNPTDDLFPDTDGGAVGGPTGYNPIDAGYHYGVDMSQAANSSIHSGGLYTNGYKAVANYSNPGGASAQSGSSRFTPDQQAVLELANEYKNGVTQGEAEILVGLANEYGISNHGPMTHPDRRGVWGCTLHIKIKNYHIEVFAQELN